MERWIPAPLRRREVYYTEGTQRRIGVSMSSLCSNKAPAVWRVAGLCGHPLLADVSRAGRGRKLSTFLVHIPVENRFNPLALLASVDALNHCPPFGLSRMPEMSQDCVAGINAGLPGMWCRPSVLISATRQRVFAR